MIVHHISRSGTRDLEARVLGCGQRVSDGLRYLALEVDYGKAAGPGLPRKVPMLVREWSAADDWQWVWGMPVKFVGALSAATVGSEFKASNRRCTRVEFTDAELTIDSLNGENWVSF